MSVAILKSPFLEPRSKQSAVDDPAQGESTVEMAIPELNIQGN
jgi:hypothetical protein